MQETNLFHHKHKKFIFSIMLQPIANKALLNIDELFDLIRTDTKKNDEKTVKIIDATFVLPGSDTNPQFEYNNKHIPGAVFFDIEKICDLTSPLPHMLPSKEVFEQALSKLGISSEDFIVIYGQAGMTMGPARLWWMFRLFKHDNIALLNAGLPAWIKANYPLEGGPQTISDKKTYIVKGYRKELLIGKTELSDISEHSRFPILDARPLARFEGKAPEPRPGMRSGHIPGSKCIPSSSLIDSNSGQLKTKSELISLFKDQGIDLTNEARPRKIITSCGSGITACMIAFALFYLGYDDFCVYDGSWAEWGQENAGTKVSKTS